MELDFWNARWQGGEIGFHQPTINPYLAYYYGEKGPVLAQRGALRVFVPLCGKSKDVLWLSQNGYAVIGVECSEIALSDFFNDNTLPLEKHYNGSHVSHRAGNIELLLGDYFALQPEQLAGVTDVYDRAALIALPSPKRRAYVEKLLALVSPGCRILLVTLTYDQQEMDGPPFSVTEAEVHALYGAQFRIDKLAAKNTLEQEPRFKQKGLTGLIETAYKLTHGG